jgi:hypothetical protein
VVLKGGRLESFDLNDFDCIMVNEFEMADLPFTIAACNKEA